MCKIGKSFLDLKTDIMLVAAAARVYKSSVASLSTHGTEIARPGAALRALRAERGWTLSDVSARTGIPPSTLSKVENDKMSLSYDKLVRISAGLSIDIGRLFGTVAAIQSEAPAFSGRRSITRAGEGVVLETPNYGHLYVAADVLNKKIVPIIAEPRAATLAEFGPLIRHSGEEYAYVLAGRIAFHSELYAPIILETGDSLYFDSGMGHAYLAADELPCRLLSICSNLAPVDGPPRVVRSV